MSNKKHEGRSGGEEKEEGACDKHVPSWNGTVGLSSHWARQENGHTVDTSNAYRLRGGGGDGKECGGDLRRRGGGAQTT